MPFADQPVSNSNTTIIDPDGDIFLAMGDSWTSNGRRFQVSSKLLVLASPTFEALLSRFTQAADPSYVGFEVSLEQADEAAMEILLSVLHFRNTDHYATLTPARLASVARLSDQYATNKALKPFTTQWLRGFATSDVDISSYGALLEAALRFGREDFFATLSAGAITRLPFKFRKTWASENIAPDLPRKIKDAIAMAIGAGLSALRRSIEGLEPKLRSEYLAIPTPRRYCPYCARVHDPIAKTCHPCNNRFLHPAFCTRDFRIAEAFNFLTKAQLWPTVDPFTTLPMREIIRRIHAAKEIAFAVHVCNKGGKCPLKVVFQHLETEAEDLLSSVEGVDLRALCG